MKGIRRLADHLDISIGTVSRALNGRPDVNEATRQRVLEAAAQMGYVPNQSGRALRKGTTGVIGFMIETGAKTAADGDTFFLSVFDGVQTVLGAFTQVADVLAALAHDDDQIAASSKAQSVAEAALNDAWAAWRLGGGAFLAVVRAQRQLNRERLALVEARGQRLADVVNLYAATAADWRGV